MKTLNAFMLSRILVGINVLLCALLFVGYIYHYKGISSGLSIAIVLFLMASLSWIKSHIRPTKGDPIFKSLVFQSLFTVLGHVIYWIILLPFLIQM
jgi:hypothetical protein